MTPSELEILAQTIAAHIKPAREVMNTEQAAEYLGVSRQFLELSRCKGGGPAFVKWARLCRYRKAALDEWLLSHEQMNTVEG